MPASTEVRRRLRAEGKLTGDEVTVDAVTPSGRRYRLSLAALAEICIGLRIPQKEGGGQTCASGMLDRLERPVLAASSTDRCNTFCELLSRCLIEQGLSRPFIELPCDSTELGLAVQGQIGATRKILAQQSVGVFV